MIWEGPVVKSEFCLAVHALIYLSRSNDTVSSDELAKNICTNPVCVRKVMSRLKRVGLVAASKGNTGGYSLIADVSQYTLKDIAEALGTRFITKGYGKDIDSPCFENSGMLSVMNSVFDAMNTACMEQLAKIKIKDIKNQISNNLREV